MVLRGAQFQRSGPAGCTFLTRRALSSYRAAFAQGRFGVVRMHQESRTTFRRLMRFHGGDQYSQSHEGLASHGASGVTYVMGILGNRHRPRNFGGDADYVHTHTLFQ
ncbi:MAG TPA: hypothetical protein VN666_03430 [Nitrospira sp.]|nr:hypothetical protein [Nitrospira sp.]